MNKNLESQAVAALKETLRQVSVIQVKEVKVEHLGQCGKKKVIAHVDIFGHPHMLVCNLEKNTDSPGVRKELLELRNLITAGSLDATPVLIAPSLSSELQALCRDNDIGFLDLDGNARIYLNEVFIVKRSFTHSKPFTPPAETLPTSETAHFADIAK